MSNESQVAFLARTTPDGATIALLTRLEWYEAERAKIWDADLPQDKRQAALVALLEELDRRASLLQGQPTTRVTQTARAELLALIAAREAREARDAA